MANERNYTVTALNTTSGDAFIIRVSRDKRGRLNNWSLHLMEANTTMELVYASHKDEILEQLDEIIDKLQAIRQDVDKTEE